MTRCGGLVLSEGKYLEGHAAQPLTPLRVLFRVDNRMSRIALRADIPERRTDVRE
jgi:hypothetical protein